MHGKSGLTAVLSCCSTAILRRFVAFALMLGAAVACALSGVCDVAAQVNDLCSGSTSVDCADLTAEGIRYTSGASTLNIGDGVLGTTVVTPGVIGIELTRAGVSGADAADAEFATIFWDTDDDPGTEDVEVVSLDNATPHLIENLYVLVQTYDDEGDPETFTVGAETYSGLELAQYLAANSADSGAAISGSLTVNNNLNGAGAAFATTNAPGILVSSTGGRGGSGGCFTILFWSWCDDGYRGGDAGSVVVNSNSLITVNGDAVEKHGVMAFSQGGDGGNGGGWFGLIGSSPGGGGDGGHGAPVFVMLGTDSNITTHGEQSHGVFARSRGGNGGQGGNVDAAIVLGSDGGNGGDAGNVLVDHDGVILTTGLNAHGIYAQSVGAGAGSGSDVGGIYAEGGNGGGESSGADVTVNNSGSITTEQDDSFGILAQSIGGGGGDGGSAGGWFTVGGRGGSGGGAGIVRVFDSGTLVTEGDRASAIFAQSIGGGGGNGGDAVSVNQNISIAVGGAGGLGGDGSEVYVIAQGSDIDTSGDDAHGLQAQSIGGGGGNGGLAVSGTLPGSLPFNVAVALGGDGGGGGDAGSLVSIQTSNETMIDTLGIRSYGILAQSIGGGGGSGGTTFAEAGGPGLSVSVSVGGKGGVAGAGNHVTIANGATITTAGDLSAGIFTQSIGGGGGNGGFAGSLAVGGGAASVSLGGSGGSGGAAGQIDVDNAGTIRTGGAHAAGIFAQSIGGGGGNGGSALSGSIGLASVATTIGGAGGVGNDGNLVDILNRGLIETHGNNSAGIFAQSVGGGGGSGGDATGLALAGPVAVAVAVGGSGGAGGVGGAVLVDNEGRILAQGSNSDGIFAQSIGGSGGSGGSATSGTLVFPVEIEGVEIPAISANVSVGGRGAGGGTAGTVTVTNAGEIRTLDFMSNGVFAQSVGGSGGRGGHATNIAIAFDATFTGKVAVGGSGGQGGIGNVVKVDNFGLIHTQGDFSSGVFAQSVGGGGGTGGNATNLTLSLTPPPMAPDDFIPTPSMNFDLAVGGDGGNGATGGAVEVSNRGRVVTEGHFAAGILAQSVGGAGGVGGDARTIQVELTADPMDFLPLTALTSLDLTLVFGGSGGTGSDGGLVKVVNESDVATTGAFSHGIVAQSVGGGGGSGGSAMSFEFSNADIVPEIPVLDDISGLTTLEMTLQGSGGAGGDGGRVELESIGSISTSGAFAMGVVAQSVAGGGGLAGFYNPHGVTRSDIASSLFNTLVDTESGLSFAGSVGGAGDAGEVFLHHAGAVRTLGDGAHGLFAQSAAGQGRADQVSITLSGTVEASGDSAHGIYAQSGGASGHGDIRVTLQDGMVMGGSGQGAGIFLMGGVDNQLTNHGSIWALSDLAVAATSGNDRVENYGNLRGSVQLGDGVNRFINNAGGVFEAGATINLGDGNLLTNAGTISPGGVGRIASSNLSGELVQSESGFLAMDLDVFRVQADHLEVSGSSRLAGQLGIFAIDAGYARPGAFNLFLLGSTSELVDEGLTLGYAPSAVAEYGLSFVEDRQLQLNYAVDFSPAGLNTNQTAIGDYINTVQSAGGAESFAPLVAALFGLPDEAALGAAYNRLTPEVYLGTEATSLAANSQLSNAMFSCPQFEGENRFTAEGDCNWMRVSGRGLIRDATAATLGYKEKAVGVAGGMQVEVADRLFFGFGLAYEDSTLRSADLTRTEGDLFQAGVMIKRHYQATLLAAGLSGGIGRYNATRFVDIPEPGLQARGKQDMRFLALRGRLAHTLEHNIWYLRPLLEGNLTYSRFDGFSESGAGAANLVVQSRNETYLSLNPALEIGAEARDRDDVLVRFFVRAGAIHYLSGTRPEITASLEGAPVGVAPFRVKGEMDRTYLDLAVGANILNKDSIGIRMEYSSQLSSDTRQHGGMIKLTVPF